MLDPRLETERLILRLLQTGDIPAIEKMNADAEVMAMSGAGGTLGKAETFKHCCINLGQWQLKGYGMYLLENKETGEFCGFVGLHDVEDNPGPELSWIMPKEKWGNGYALEAARAVKDHAFQKMKLEQFYHYIDPENARSIRLAENLGATRIDEIRKKIGDRERVVDIVYVSRP